MTKPLSPDEKRKRTAARALRKRTKAKGQADYEAGVEEGLLRAAHFFEREAALLLVSETYRGTLWDRYGDGDPDDYIDSDTIELMRAYVRDTAETLVMGGFQTHTRMPRLR